MITHNVAIWKEYIIFIFIFLLGIKENQLRKLIPHKFNLIEKKYEENERGDFSGYQVKFFKVMYNTSYYLITTFPIQFMKVVKIYIFPVVFLNKK